MMTISSKKGSTKRRKKLVVIIAATILLLAAGVIAYIFMQQQAEQERLRTTQPSGSAKNDIINSGKDSTTSNAGLPEDTTTTTSEQVPTSDSLSVSISSTSQSDGLVRASAKTNGSGMCVFLYKPADGGKPVTRQVEITDSTCSFEASQNEFSYLGKWTLTVTYYSDNNKAEATQDVTIH